MNTNSQNTDFDIVIPVYQNYDGIMACLQSLVPHFQKEISFRVIVCVDADEDDNTYQSLQEKVYPYQLLVLKHPDGKRHGRNATRNLSIPHITAKFILTIDSDMLAGEKLLAQHLLYLTRNFPCISLGGVIYSEAKVNFWADYLNYRGKAKYQAGEELPYYYLAMGNAAFPAQSWVDLGGQDANMTRYGGGDTEFAYRMHQRFAWKTYYNPEAAVFALTEKNISTALQQYEEFGQFNLKYIRQKHPQFIKLFRFDLWGFNSLSARLIRFLWSFNWAACLFPLILHSPDFLRRIIIHFLVGNQIVRGYLKK